MKFCSQCGASVTLRVPAGDNLPRHVCDACETIHYLNPKVVAGCILEWQDRVLLCRRAIEPRYGLWTLPAGFMENGESALAAAAREALEEAHAESENLRLYGVYSLLHVSQVYLMFQGRLKDGYARPGEESLEVRLCAETEIPWDQIAFTVVHETLRQYFAERRTGQFHHHLGDIIREADQRFRIHRHY
ncbi:MAG TPA: NUDIX hydrolase [Candidatus Competibacter sp.]|nr:NUDIX hydrolase [Candidatus Competibacteraceae bacterium]HRC73070.1 NUDIX hydrolase [Candidatus Competibacter sp.]